MADPSEAVVVLQARTGSTRLPGKVLMPFGGTTLLQHILRRLMPTGLELVVATTADAADDDVAGLAAAEGARVHRGSKEDVLARFAGAVRALPALPRWVVRVCADRPFVSAGQLTELLAFAAEVQPADYVANNLQASYPHGLDLELVTTPALLLADGEAAHPYEREHVTPFVYRRPERFTLVGMTCPYGNFSGVRATIDTAEDYDALKIVHDELARLRRDYDVHDVLNLATTRPELFP